MKHERLDDWTLALLPVAPPTGFRSFLRVIGPAVIMIGISIGSGEWLIGPAAAVRYGVAMLGIVPSRFQHRADALHGQYR